MKRGYTRRDVMDTISLIRQNVADAVLRTTLIVGYPGETDRQFNALKEFVKQVEFDRLGVFKYSPQEGTRSYDLANEVPEAVKEERFHEIMTIQSEISARMNEGLVGKTFRALVDDVEENTCIARLYSHAPEIDGEVIIEDCSEDRVGQFVHVRITGAYEYDLAGEIVNE
jgi:ribosomal protein S12 methylthiotransferase